MMKTGFGESSGAYENTQLEALYGILNPVLEKSVIIASHYAKQCGRDVLLAEDWLAAMKYCAMHEVGKHTGSILPEGDDDGEEAETLDIAEDSDIKWVPYLGDDPTCNAVNAACVGWEDWKPTNPAEEMLKHAVEKCEL
jgi:hypothetical protein